MGTPECPDSSRPLRMASTRPSIMSEGAMMSAPACAQVTAICVRSGSVAPLSTSPWAPTNPQWPWEVYSHRHTSAHTCMSGTASFTARIALWTMPSFS